MTAEQDQTPAPPAEPIEPDETTEQFIERRNTLERPPAPAPAPVPETPPAPPAPPESPAPAAPETPAEPAQAPVPEPHKLTAEERIQQIVAKQKEAERREAQRAEEAAYWRAVAEGRIKPTAPPNGQPPAPPAQPAQPGEPVEPVLDNFESMTDFEAARTKYIVAKATWDLRQNLQAQEAQRYTAELDRKHDERMIVAIAADPTLEEAAKDPTLPISLVMSLSIKESDHGPALVRYLADHRQEADRIARLHPVLAAREMGRIEGQIMAAKATPSVQPEKPVAVSQAPEPVKPVGGTKGAAPVEDDDDKLSVQEFIERRNMKQYGKK